MDRYVSPEPLEIPAFEELDQMSRADLVFYGVDHSQASYEGRVFFNNAEATPETPLVLEEGYAGSFTVFGHAGCYGDDESHCDPREGFRDAFDRRLPPPLAPFTKTVIVTEALRNMRESGIFVTVVAVVPEVEGGSSSRDVLRFDTVRLLTYEDPAIDEATDKNVGEDENA